MSKKQLAIIYPAYAEIEIIKELLPNIIESIEAHGNSILILYCSDGRNIEDSKKIEYLKSVENHNSVFLIISTPLSISDAISICVYAGNNLCTPDYICVVTPNFLFKKNTILNLINCMKKNYGGNNRTKLPYGVFTLHNTVKAENSNDESDTNYY
jgi:hypothetical protein